MRCLIMGDNIIDNYHLIVKELNFLTDEDHVLTNGGTGAGRLIQRYCETNEIYCEVIKPDWDELGAMAGFKNNDDLFDLKPEYVFLFWNGEFVGTKDVFEKAQRAGIKTTIVWV